MEHNNSNERWIEDVLASTKGIERVPARNNMYEGVMNRLKESGGSAKNSIGFVGVRVVAAAAVLLLVVNLVSIYHYANKNKAVHESGVYQSVNEDISNLSDDNF